MDTDNEECLFVPRNASTLQIWEKYLHYGISKDVIRISIHDMITMIIFLTKMIIRGLEIIFYNTFMIYQIEFVCLISNKFLIAIQHVIR